MGDWDDVPDIGGDWTEPSGTELAKPAQSGAEAHVEPVMGEKAKRRAAAKEKSAAKKRARKRSRSAADSSVAQSTPDRASKGGRAEGGGLNAKRGRGGAGAAEQRAARGHSDAPTGGDGKHQAAGKSGGGGGGGSPGEAPVGGADADKAARKREKRRRRKAAQRHARAAAARAEANGGDDAGTPGAEEPQRANSEGPTGEDGADGAAVTMGSKRRKRRRQQPKAAEPTETPSGAAPAPAAPRPSRLSMLQNKMRSKLKGAQFRWLNEQLYTRPGDAALKMFSEDPEQFDVYHRGFREQVEKWPVNPLDVIIRHVKAAPKGTRVADFGCGEARLSASVPHKTHSFDLVAANDRVTACDIAHVPLGNECVDIAVFCLSLMGTDYIDFLREARRVLVPGGRLFVAEVRSRFSRPGVAGGAGDGGAGGDSDDDAPRGPKRGSKRGPNKKRGKQMAPANDGDLATFDAFVEQLTELGFKEESRDVDNRMFVLLTMRKAGRTSGDVADDDVVPLRPCLYKKR